MNERRPVSRTLVPTKPTRRIVSALTTSIVVALAVAGCSATSKSTGKTAATTAEIDPKLGVAPSPRVVAFGEPVPKGGGRTMVGKPYKVAGKRYVPRLEPNYSKVGLASWYGNAFHGRKTANGEVFDSEHLSAAHPTMPLPSYARVTSVTTGRSVVVRVNDRGPFHSNRLIDISRRTAEVIGVRSAGIAKVKVEYIGAAPAHGDDHEYLMASYRGPADLPDRLPETMIASAEPLPGVAVRAANSAASAAAGLFGGGKTAPTATATADPAPVGPRIPGSVLPPVRPLLDGEVYVMVASVDPADVYFATGTQVASLDLPDVTPVGYTPASFQVGAQPLDGGAALPPAQPLHRSYAEERVSQAYAAVDSMGEGVALSDLTRRLEALSSGAGVDAARSPSPLPTPADAAKGAVVQIGFFGNPDNATRLANRLHGLGAVAMDAIVVNGQAMTRVRMTALTAAAEDVVAAAEKAGAHGAQILR